MIKKKVYRANNKMRELIDDNPYLLFVMSRFGISLGFGDSTINEVCSTQKVDLNTFLAVTNLISGNPYDSEDISLQCLLDCLRSAHSYFLSYQLPYIRKKLIEVVGYDGDNNVTMMLLKYFDSYVSEVKKHMDYENDKVFRYASQLLDRETVDSSFNLSAFASKHTAMSNKLIELKDIIIRYYPQKNSDLLNSILMDLIACGQDMDAHCEIEDKLFIPEVAKMELALKQTQATAESDGSDGSLEGQNLNQMMEMLSDREIEIVKCVAKGMANKEIADKLCLSINTVTTHRRNICNKLGIHSPAGLTIFCIINKLVNLDEIKILK